jgi:tyrosyl-tRNA synthetase
MNLEERLELITRGTVEIVTREDAISLLQTNPGPKGYIGVEPSGLFHVGWMIWSNKFLDMMNAGAKMTLLEATWHAWINDKFGGDMRKIQLCANYIEHCLKALGVDLGSVTVVKADDLVKDKSYWEGLVRVAKSLSLARVKRGVTIMGRKEDETMTDFSKLIYPCMQVEDIFYLDLDLCLGGMDQRRAHVLAREVAESGSRKKPIAIHTPLLSSLQGSGRMDTLGEADEAMMESKMSKSRPETCLFIHDSPEMIKSKINAGFCPPKVVEGNPVLDIARFILMRDSDFTITRSQKYGGDLNFTTPGELTAAYSEGKIHPLDLKNSVSNDLAVRLKPVREYFDKVQEAKSALESLSSSACKT